MKVSHVEEFELSDRQIAILRICLTNNCWIKFQNQDHTPHRQLVELKLLDYSNYNNLGRHYRITTKGKQVLTKVDEIRRLERETVTVKDEPLISSAGYEKL